MEQLIWTTVKRKVKELVPYEYNPRFMTEERKERLRKSIEKFNLVEIPVINQSNVLLAGHQRIKILMDAGKGEEIIDCRYPNRELTTEEFKEYNITSNLPAGFWDRDLLEEAFQDIDLKSLGLDIDKIEIPEHIVEKKEEEQDFVIDIPYNPVSQVGDLIELHSMDKRLVHRIQCASSIEKEALQNLFLDKRADCICTDPPYNVDYTGGTDQALKIQNDNMSDEEFYQFLHSFYSAACAFTHPGAGIYVFHADSEGANFRTALKKAGFKLAQCLIWLKNSMVMGRQDYQWIHEPILYGWKEGAAHKFYNDRSQTTVIEFPKPIRNEDHPTMKPVGLIEYLIQNSSRRYQVVFDGFLGSGSCLIASEKNKRHCYGQELDPRYMDVIVRRWISYMKDNGLDFKLIRNGVELSEKDVQEFYSRAGK
jgi:DNA modification methylase